MNNRILIVDDEMNARDGLRKALENPERVIETAPDGKDAVEKLGQRTFDVMLTDIRMPRMGGMELLRKAREEWPEMDVIVITAYGEVKNAVEAMKIGAYDYLQKPIDLDELELKIERLMERRRLSMENEQLRKDNRGRSGLGQIIGDSPVMQTLFDDIRQVAPSRATVLITGETGSGKELVARAIHDLSSRQDQHFWPMHCAAFSETLLESELFGHERGSFTGAVKQKKGRFELANRGTVFLDEISEISPKTQVKLLRILQERCFERVGGTDTISVDIRVIAATNADLAERVTEGKFREDLLYRLQVVTLSVPPLRDRREDIPLLVNVFLKRYAAENEVPLPSIDPAVIRAFQAYDWPGNVRELQGYVERMVVMCRGDRITADNLPPQLGGRAERTPVSCLSGDVPLADVEKHVILETLRRNNGNRTKTAEVLGIGRRTLIRKLQEYGDDVDV
ncbi:MAG: sigma-54 dependent transcriptional regulator [bacterium]